MSLLYILKDKKVISASPDEFYEFFADFGNRRVARETVGDSDISTVFLGIDHGCGNEPGRRPVVFETMVFGGPLDQEQERCYTWDEAEFQHAQMVERVRNA